MYINCFRLEVCEGNYCYYYFYTKRVVYELKGTSNCMLTETVQDRLICFLGSPNAHMIMQIHIYEIFLGYVEFCSILFELHSRPAYLNH